MRNFEAGGFRFPGLRQLSQTMEREMDKHPLEKQSEPLIRASLGVALSLIPAYWAHAVEKRPNCEPPQKICFFVPGNPQFLPHPYDGEIILVANQKPPVKTLSGQVTVYEVDGVATSPASTTFPPTGTPDSWDWYSSPISGSAYQEPRPRGHRPPPQQCNRIQYSLDSIGAFTAETAPPVSSFFEYVTQTVHAQLALVYDPNDGTATISQLGQATRTCYDSGGTLDPTCGGHFTTQSDVNGIFPAHRIDCDQAHTPKVPPLLIPPAAP